MITSPSPVIKGAVVVVVDLRRPRVVLVGVVLVVVVVVVVVVLNQPLNGAIRQALEGHKEGMVSPSWLEEEEWWW